MDIMNIFSHDRGDQTSGAQSVSSSVPDVASEDTPHSELPSRSPTISSGGCTSPLPIKHWVKVVLRQLPADGRVKIFLRNTEESFWTMGDENANLVGIALATPSRSEVLRLINFVINRDTLTFDTYSGCGEIELEICVTCARKEIHGYVDLPVGAIITFQSEVDRTSLVGLSSFALGLAT